MKLIRSAYVFALSMCCILSFSGCASRCHVKGGRSHALIGAWKADDRTIFIFRADGTFRGADFRKTEIWGNWVELSPTRIGFQSLLHDSFYRPQYAVISADKDQMNYIVTGGTRFIHARRIPVEEAYSTLDEILSAKIILPEPGNRN